VGLLEHSTMINYELRPAARDKELKAMHQTTPEMSSGSIMMHFTLFDPHRRFLLRSGLITAT